jgi:hypothetical protein
MIRGSLASIELIFVNYLRITFWLLYSTFIFSTMGNAHSVGTPSRTIIIDEWEIPPAYKSVGVSEEVVNAVSKVPMKTESRETPKESLEKPKESIGKPTGNKESLEELEEKKRAFDDAVQRLEKKHFGRRNENFFADVEQVSSY